MVSACPDTKFLSVLHPKVDDDDDDDDDHDGDDGDGDDEEGG